MQVLQKKGWPAVAKEIGPIVNTDAHLVKRVVENITMDEVAAGRKQGAGRPPHVAPGTVKTDLLVGTFQSDLGSRHTASKINELGVSLGKKPS